MPRTLFLKIFLWFSAIVFTVVVGTFLVSELNRPDPFQRPERVPIDPVVSAYAKTAADIYEQHGQSGLVGYLDRIQHESHVRGFLFNRQLQELSGRRMPSDAPNVARRAFENSIPDDGTGPGPLLARRANSARGGEYALVVELPGHMPPESLFHPLLHLLAILLTGGLFCYWLARHLTSPVGKLRAATQEFAKGNLSVRVGPTMGKRRDELASLAADFDLMAEKIESLINSQRRLLGDISHELRSPLARMNVALELARQRAGKDAAGALERIQHEAENLNEMIGQLLALTRLESGAEGLQKSQFDLAELVTAITRDAQFEASNRDRSVRLRVNGRCLTVGNQLLLQRAIENVVRNAVQYTAPGTEVEVELQCQSAVGNGSVAAEVANSKLKDQSTKLSESDTESDSQSYAVITVRDHGAGVPEEALAEIFKPFYRVDDARDRQAGGVGLGLAIAERAVRLHDGKIEASNEPTGGLLVRITLPKERTANSRQQTADSKRRTAGGG
jgi:two-component system sensor histidine kinase CpxA